MTEKETKNYWTGIGRRKTAIASVKIVSEKPVFVYNGQKSDLPQVISKVLELVGKKDDFSISARVLGGGIESQIDAIKLGVARALIKYNEEFKTTLKKEGYLTRDPREKERKKPGLHGARRAPQWAKR